MTLSDVTVSRNRLAAILFDAIVLNSQSKIVKNVSGSLYSIESLHYWYNN